MTLYGAAYYPEQETAAEVVADAERMQAIGFSVARIGEFAWCKMEPRDGEFDLAWLDHAIAALGERGVRTILCTPTACPPLWMVEAHPEILYRDQRGVVRPFGARRHYCYNQPVYRRYCERIAAELAKRYGSRAEIAGFHIDNELGQEATGRCTCSACALGFQAWLARRFGTIQEFNRRAGTVFWGMDYARFDQIAPPVRTIENGAPELLNDYVDNPTVRLEWERFSSDSIIGFMRVQVEAMRRHSKIPITTNATGMWTNSTDYFEAFGGLDVAGGDIYPGLRGNDQYGAGCDFAFHRGLKRRKFWVLETTSGGGQGVWARQGIPQPFPGALRQNAILAAASDATAITYFQFKMFRFGAEQLEASVLNIDGIPRRQEREFRQAAGELRELQGLLEASQVANDVALVYSYDAHWAIKIKPFHRAYSYQHHVSTIYGCLASRGVGCDIADLNGALAHYKMVILPCPLLLADDEREAITRFCAGGGTVVTTFLAGIKGPDNTAERAAIPARLTGTFGMRVAEGEPVVRESWGPDTSGLVRFQLGKETLTCRNRWWTEMLEPDGAEVIARYSDTYRKGEAVATRMRHGTGSAIYLGTWPDEDEAAAAVLAWAAREAGVAPAPLRFPRGVEAVRRRGPQGEFWMVFNCREEEAALELTVPMRDLLLPRTLDGTVPMPAKSHLVLAPA